MDNFTISCFADEIAGDFKTQIEEVKNFGIEYIEIRKLDGRIITLYTLDEIREIKKKLDQNGIKVSAIGSPIGKYKITDDFAPHLEFFKHTVAAAEILETKYIRMFSFFIEKGQDPEDYFDEVVSRWRAFIDAVGDRDITLLHENESHIYGDIAPRCKRLLAELDHPKVRAIFDPANFIQVGQKTYPDAFELLKNYIVYMHIKDALEDGTVVPSGEGAGHVKEILRELKDAGYKGFLSIEPHLKDGDMSIGGVARFKRAYDGLKKVMEGLV